MASQIVIVTEALTRLWPVVGQCRRRWRAHRSTRECGRRLHVFASPRCRLATRARKASTFGPIETSMSARRARSTRRSRSSSSRPCRRRGAPCRPHRLRPAEALHPEQFAEFYDVTVLRHQRVNRVGPAHMRADAAAGSSWSVAAAAPAARPYLSPGLAATRRRWMRSPCNMRGACALGDRDDRDPRARRLRR